VPENDNADRVASAAEQAEKRTEETRGFMRSVRRATPRLVPNDSSWGNVPRTRR